MNAMSWIIAVDVGGTFTDVVAIGSDNTLRVAKVPSTPYDPSLGFLQGLKAVLFGTDDVGPKSVAAILHGTTVATNAILEGKLSRVALITTRGFRHVLHIGRHDIPRGVSPYAYVKPKKPVEPDMIFEVTERLDHRGRVVIPLVEDELVSVSRKLREKGVESVAVVFLHSYANRRHEDRAKRILTAELPGVHVSLSSEVRPVMREYERSLLTVWNAGLAPGVSTYIRSVAGQLESTGAASRLLIMKSDGGLASAEEAVVRPIELCLSGPAAGAIGAAWVARQAGFKDAIALDMGGTSADVAVIRSGEVGLVLSQELGGLPLSLPMVDVLSIGAGGGSIARVTSYGTLAVGPQSAGAVPGPACYGKGGSEPTVTDANVVLGRLPSLRLASGMPLDSEAAAYAIKTRIADPLGLALEDAALGILEIVDHNMAAAIRKLTIERGYDPREFVLVAFGGAGPLHACHLARLLGVRKVLVPRLPGLLAAVGLLVADVTAKFEVTFIQRQGTIDLDQVESTFSALEAKAREWEVSHRSDFGLAQLRFNRQLDVRYAGQGFEVSVEYPTGKAGTDWLAEVGRRFALEHRRLYGHEKNAPFEIVNIRVLAQGVRIKPELRRYRGARDWNIGRRTSVVRFGRDSGWLECPVISRSALQARGRLDGPAVIEQEDSTVLIWPGDRAVVDDLENLIIEVDADERGLGVVS